ncbi:ATP-binding cassette domain-containing protein [Amycolatopsis japonica]|uniref:ATP-binding cassette domain-containing protein n=1 Tax=Amycolatopsis japonica TaxID=208439 RepID=UPI00366DB2AD
MAAGPMIAAPMLALRSVSKRFPAVQALDTVDLAIQGGQIHALLGQNGAGKSTAGRILAGLDTPDEGYVEVAGSPARFAGRSDAIERGVGFIPQADSLVDDLTLVDTLALSQPHRLVRRRTLTAKLRTTASHAGVPIALDTPARHLSRGERQLGELVLALAQGARVLLLDEPTSALGPREVKTLFDHLRAVADTGVAVLLITHHLADVRQVADAATVLAHGRVVHTGPVVDVNDRTLARAIVGDELDAPPPRHTRTPGQDVLVLSNVSATCGDPVPVRDISLRIRAGEVVGVVGVAGNGQRALAEVAAGRIAPATGTVSGGPRVAYVPERRLDALLPERAAWWSAMVTRLREPAFSRRGALDTTALVRAAGALFDRHDVRPRDPRVAVTALSGGNQQKLLAGRELDDGPDVVVLHGPTQGLDLLATHAIHKEINRAADAGTAVLVISADLDEARQLADRLVVLSKGRIVADVPADELDDTVVWRLSSGLSAAGGEPDRTIEDAAE